MPLYEYECTSCHRRTEKIQKFSDPDLTICPFCGGVLERTLTAPNIQFKGGGWYKDLYSSARSPTNGGDSAAASSDSASADGGSKAPESGAGSGSRPGEGAKSDSAKPAATPSSSPASAAPATTKP